MELSEFVRRFRSLREQGFVKSLRRGPTGVGHTLEHMLGLSENNIAVPDIGGAELKAHREDSSSMVTLFTFNRKVWRVPPLQAVRKYGTLDEKGRLGLYFTMSMTPNSSGLFLHVGDEAISVRHISGEVLAEWNLLRLAKRFQQKIPALILVSARVELRADVEYFHYYRAKLLAGTDTSLLANQFLKLKQSCQ